MSIKERILFVGVGQAGGNVVNLFEKKGYCTTYINTSSEDLRTLDTETAKVFHIPTGTGCSKDKERAKKYIRNHGQAMINHIEDKYPNLDMVFFVFSGGGGTGAGIAPALIDCLASSNQHKKYGAILIMPSLKESTVCLKNAAGTYSDVTGIEDIRSVFVLDNSSAADKLSINKGFVNNFDKFIKSAGNIDNRGNIDADELETLLTAKGVSIILEAIKDESGAYGFTNELYPDFTKGCGKVGITTKNDSEEFKALIEEEIGIPDVYFDGHNENCDIAIITEMNYPVEMLNSFVEVVSDRESKRDRDGAAVVKNPFAKEAATVVDVEASLAPTPRRNKPDVKKAMSKWF